MHLPDLGRVLRVRGPVVVAIVGLLTACGGTSHRGNGDATYNSKMATVVPVLQGSLLKGRLALEQIQSPRAAKAQVHALERKLRNGIATLQATRPPQVVARDHSRLVAGYGGVLTDVAKLEPLTRRPTMSALRVAAGRLDRASSFRAVGAALEAIVAKGYGLGLRTD